MGMFIDMLQQMSISENAEKVDKASAKAHKSAVRIKALENGLAKTNALLAEVVRRLEQQSNEDINSDGQIG